MASRRGGLTVKNVFDAVSIGVVEKKSLQILYEKGFNSSQ